MEQQSYYRIVSISGGNLQVEEEPLVVNCAGNCLIKKTFITDNPGGRLDYYLQLMTAGQMSVWIEGEKHTMKPGMFLLYRPKTGFRYALEPADLAAGPMEYLWIHFTGFHAGRLLSRLGLEFSRLYTVADAPNIQKSPVIGLFTALFGEFVNRRWGFDDACAALLTKILVTLSRDTITDTVPAKRPLLTLAWLHRHFMEDHSIADLAAMEHLSQSRYRHVFREQTGVSPIEYRIALRMQHACDLLQTTDQSIQDISSACGYSDTLYFIRLFKQKTGLPPGAYRNQMKNGSKPEITGEIS